MHFRGQKGTVTFTAPGQIPRVFDDALSVTRGSGISLCRDSGMCDELMPGDIVTVACEFSTTGDAQWVPWGMGGGEMCSAWLYGVPSSTKDLVPTSTLFAHKWRPRLATSINDFDQDLDADRQLSASMVKRFATAVGVDSSLANILEPVTVRSIYDAGVEKARAGLLGVNTLAKGVN
jgi:hypothetical protein